MRFSMMPKEADIICAKFEGIGPNIYTTRKDRWMELLDRERGEGLYVRLLSLSNERGAVLKDMRMGHGAFSRK